MLPEIRQWPGQIEANPFLTWEYSINEVDKLLGQVRAHLTEPIRPLHPAGQAATSLHCSKSRFVTWGFLKPKHCRGAGGAANEL